MATGGRYLSSKERVNYGRLCRIVVDLCADVMRTILTKLVVPNQLLIEVRNCSDLKTLAADELQRINRAVAGSSYEKFDISFLYTLIRAIGTQELRYELDKNIPANNIWTKLQSTPSLMAQLTRKQSIVVQNATDYSGFDCGLLTLIILNLTSVNIPNIIPSAHKWGGKTLPNCTNTKLGDDIERIRFIRNTVYGHVSDSCVTDSEFRNYVTELTGIMQRMDQEFNTGGQYLKDLNDIKTASLDDKWEIYESTIRELVEREQEIKDRLEIQEESTQQLQKDVNKIESRLETQEDSTGQLQKGVTSLDKRIEEMGGRVDVVQKQVISLSLAQVQNLLKHITTAKQLWDASKSLYEEIKAEHLLGKAENKLRELKRKGDRWDKSIDSAIDLETELQGSRPYAPEPLTPDALEKELQRIQPSKDFKFLQYLLDAQKFDHEHNIHQVIDAASKEIKLKKQVQNLLENITTAKQLWDASKEMFEEIKAEHLLEKAENKLRELERKKDRWDKSIETAVKLEKELQGSRPYDADPFTFDTLEKELQRVQPSTDFKYLQYLQDAQKTEHEHNIHRIINAASKEIGLKKEEIGPRKLEDWKKTDNTFYPTKATSLISEKIKSKKKVVAFGLPGSGKTAIIRHVALKLKNEGHRLCCVQTFNELKCKMYKFGEEEKQVYVIDDVFGVHGVDELKRKQWCDDNKDEVERCLNNPNISILCSSRMQVLNDDKLNTIKSRFTIVNISEGECELSKDERVGIFRNHAITKERNDLLTEKKDQLKDEINEDIREIECPVGCFPLVCHLYTGDTEPKQTIDEYFNKPLNVIADHLEKLKVEDRLSHFCLLLCLIYENKLPVNTMKVGKEEEETKNKREELLEICELPGSTLRTTIKNKMDALLQTFVKREGDQYKFVHDIVHDAVIKHIGSLKSDVLEVILRHCKVLLCVACDRRCDTDVVQALIDAGADVNTQDVDGRHALLWSVWYGDYETTQLLLDRKADVNLCDNQGWSALYWSVYKGHYETTQLLLDHGADVNLCEKECGSPALHRSVYKGDYKTTQLLLAHGADVNLCTNQGMSALYGSVDNGDYKTTQLLLDHKAGVNLCNNQGWSALYRSVDKGDYKTTQLLLDHMADVNLCTKDTWGWSALHSCMSKGDFKTIQLLLDHKADVNLCDKDGRSPFYWSEVTGNDTITELLESHGAVCMYNGTQYNHATDIPDLPLCDFVEHNNYQAVKLLIDRGANVNQCDTKFDWSSLFMSQLTEHEKITSLLQSHDAVCLYKGKHYNHITDIPDCEVHDDNFGILVGDEIVSVKKRIQDLKEKTKRD